MIDRPDSPRPVVGQRISQYEIRAPLGAGGMGEVWLAQDRTLERPVALKFLSDERQHDATARRRFLREAKAAAALDHPYICKIYETGDAAGRPFIAMEYVRGETVATRLTGEPLPLRNVLRIATEVAEALETAHGAGLVHRDLKPANIMLTSGGHVKVLDFGLAKRVEHAADDAGATASALTEVGTIHGTVAYMSPEQVRGKVVDLRSDVFAFGVVLYELLTGRHPFRKETPLETAAAILSQTPAPLRHHRQDAPERLDHIVGKMLAKAPAERYQRVHDVRTDLAQVSDSVERDQAPLDVPAALPPRTVRPSAGTRPTPRASASRTRVVIASASAVVAVLAALWMWWETGPARPGSRAEAPSVAVLPLSNLSRTPEDTDYLADGITQAVITRLIQAGLRVTPWETALRFRDSREPTEQIARDLNVGTVLVGTFQFEDDQLLTTLSLVEADSGLSTWADEFEEPYTNLFDVQRRIARGAAESLMQELTGEQEATLARPESVSVDAYDSYLQGAYLMQEGTQEATDVAFQYFTRAAELDPRLTDAHVGLGTVYQVRFVNGWGGGSGNLEWAEASFETALGLDPGSLRARRGLMQVYWGLGRSEAILLQGQEAGRVGRPEDVETLMARAQAFVLSGLHVLAIPIHRRVIAIDPRNELAYWMLTWASGASGRLEETVELGTTFLSLFGDDGQVRLWIARAADGLADDDLAREHYEALTQRFEARPTDPARVSWSGLSGLLYAGAFYDRSGERDRAEALWQRGVELARVNLATDPESISMRLFLACFHGFLGEREALLMEETRALAAAREFDVVAWEIPALAAAHASVGNADRAVGLLRDLLQRGRLVSSLMPFEGLSPSLLEAPGFEDFRREYEAMDRRLRERYGPES